MKNICFEVQMSLCVYEQSKKGMDFKMNLKFYIQKTINKQTKPKQPALKMGKT